MAYTPVNGHRGGRVLLTLLLAAILAVAAVFGGYLWGHHTATTAATQATASVDGSAVTAAVPTVPAGPARIVGGIPSGFSHDRNGAIAAGIGFLQAVASIDGGLSSPSAVQTQMAAANPSAAVLKRINGDGTSNPAPLPAGIVEGFNETPIAVKVLALNAASAQLSFWSCFSGGVSNAPGEPINATTDCSMGSVALSWERGDWKVADYLAANGGKTSLLELTRSSGYQVLIGSYTILTVGQP